MGADSFLKIPSLGSGGSQHLQGSGKGWPPPMPRVFMDFHSVI